AQRSRERRHAERPFAERAWRGKQNIDRRFRYYSQVEADARPGKARIGVVRRTSRGPNGCSDIARSAADEAIHTFFADRWIASRSLSSGAHSRDPLARNDAFISNSGRHHFAAPAQADILQFGDHAVSDGLRDDHDLAKQVRIDRAGEQQRDAYERPGGVTGDHEQHQRPRHRQARAEPADPRGIGNQAQPSFAQQRFRQIEEGREYAGAKREANGRYAAEDGIGQQSAAQKRGRVDHGSLLRLLGVLAQRDQDRS